MTKITCLLPAIMSTIFEHEKRSRLSRAEWYLAASRLNEIAYALGPDLNALMLKSRESLSERETFVRGLLHKEVREQCM